MSYTCLNDKKYQMSYTCSVYMGVKWVTCVQYIWVSDVRITRVRTFKHFTSSYLTFLHNNILTIISTGTTLDYCSAYDTARCTQSSKGTGRLLFNDRVVVVPAIIVTFCCIIAIRLPYGSLVYIYIVIVIYNSNIRLEVAYAIFH